jgi:hypothetical protein
VRDQVRDQVRDKLDVACDDLGEQQVKDIARPAASTAFRSLRARQQKRRCHYLAGGAAFPEHDRR